MKLGSVLDLVERYDSSYEFAKHYGERGYTDPKALIIFANWNDVPNYIQEGLKRRGYELEWSDEWIVEHEESKAYRTSPTHYGWRPSYIVTEDGEIWNRRTMDLEAYAEALENDPKACDTVDRDFTELGFVKGEESQYESGFHSGQNDDPEKIYESLKDRYDVIFAIDSTGQFDIMFSVWLKSKDLGSSD